MKEMVFQQKATGKSRFHLLADWSGKSPAGQFWQMESGLVCYTATAVFSVVTGEALRDDSKNGCVAD